MRLPAVPSAAARGVAHGGGAGQHER